MAGENNPLSYAFWAGTPSNSPLSYDALQTRRKIAEQLMGKRSPFPKTFGEGLTYAGERFADVMDMNRLDAAEKQQAAYEKNVLSGGPPGPGSENTAVAPASTPNASSSVPPAASSSPTYFPPAAGVNEIPIPPPRPVLNRSQFQGEMDANPTLAAKMQTIVQGEVGRGASEQEKKIQLEEIFNRAAARGQTLEQVTRQYTGPGSSGYYPASTFQHGQARGPEEYQDFQQRIMTPVLRGSDVGGQALGFSPTGNASGDVAASGIRRGYYTQSGKLPGGAETYVQHRPDDIAQLNATRVPGRDAIAATIADQPEPTQNAMPPSPAVPYTDFTGLGATPPAPVRTAALTTPGVASDAGPQVAALPPQTPLDPANNAPIPSPIPLAPTEVRTPGTIPPSQAGVALPVPPKPRDPGPQPTMPPPTPTMNWLDSIARNRGLNPETRADAQSKYNNLLKVQHDVFTNDLKAHKEDVRKFNDPATAIALTEAAYKAEETKRKLEGEGFFELSPEEKARMGPDIPGVKLYKDRYGNLQKIVGPQTVSIDMAGEKAEAQGIGKHTAERHGKMMEAANTAGNSLHTLNRAEALFNKIDTNALAPAKLTVSALGRALGVSDEALRSINLNPEQTGSMQAFNAIVGDLVIGKIGAGGFPANNFSNPDREFLTSTMPRLGDDPESNRIKLASAKLVATRDLEKAGEWSKFKNAPENKGKSFTDFEDHWNAKVSRSDLTGELKKQAEALIANAASVPPDAVNMLRANPGLADKFDKVFGPGASKRYLGQ